MYNRYINDSDLYMEDINAGGSLEEPEPIKKVGSFVNNGKKSSANDMISQVSSLFANRIKTPKLTVENIILLAIVYFLLADSNELELFVIVGALLFLGL